MAPHPAMAMAGRQPITAALWEGWGQQAPVPTQPATPKPRPKPYPPQHTHTHMSPTMLTKASTIPICSHPQTP